MEAADVVELVLQRRQYLEQLAKQPQRRSNLVDLVGDSRPTVHRATEELDEAGLVEKQDGTYEITRDGELILDAVRGATAATDTIGSGDGLIEHFPDEAPLDPVFFRDAEAVPVQPPSMEANVERAIRRIKEADRLSGLGVADNSTKFAQTIYEQSVKNQELQLDLVLEKHVMESLVDRHIDWMVNLVESDYADIRVCESIPYGMYVADEGPSPADGIVYLLVHGEQSEYRGHFEAESQPAIRWAEVVFRDYFVAAEPLEEYVPEDALESEPS